MDRELSVFVDESGDAGETSRFYLITLVFHEQSTDIQPAIQAYERVLKDGKLDDIPVHLGPLLTANDDYKHLGVETRKRMLSRFEMFSEHLPFSYVTFSYEKSQFSNDSVALLTCMKRDLILMLFDNLEYFQQFNVIKVYYNNGQSIVTHALHDSSEYVLVKDAVIYKDASPRAYRLLQVADYICTLELTALKFQTHDDRPTDRLFFGNWGSFKKNYLRKVRKHLL